MFMICFSQEKVEEMKIETVNDVIYELKSIRNNIVMKRKKDTRTKNLVNKLFNKAISYLEYQKPMPAINVSNNGHYFECPRCHTKFESEDTVDMFNGCYVCLQRWKEEEE